MGDQEKVDSASPADIKVHYQAHNNFLWFCQNILGYRADKAIGYYDFNKPLIDLCHFLMGPSQNKLVLCPRESLKSQICTVGYPLWKLVRNPNLSILIYSDSSTKAQAFLQGMKFQIEGKAPNSLFRKYYPRWELTSHQGGTYNESRINIRIREFEQKEPSVDTGGIETSKVGMHYDLIIYDDIVTDLNVTTKAQMDKVHELYKKSLSLLKRGGEVLMVGTRWHFGDTYGRLIEENKQTQEFATFIQDAEARNADGELLYADIGLTREWLDKQKIKQGSYLFSCLYRNNPASDEDALFKIENFNYYNPHPDLHKNMYITGTLDPAGEGQDYSAITVCGTDNKDRMYVLEAINERMTPSQIIDRVIQLNYRWGFDKFAVERNYFKGALEKEFKEVALLHQGKKGWKTFGFFEDIIASAKTKNSSRVLALQPLHEARNIYLPCNGAMGFNNLSTAYSELAYQMIRYSITQLKCMAPHDDLLMSLAFHAEIRHRGGEAMVGDAPPTSFERHMKDSVAQYNTMQRRLPRHARKFINY